MWPRLTFIFSSSCLYLWSARITGVSHPPWLTGTQGHACWAGSETGILYRPVRDTVSLFLSLVCSGQQIDPWLLKTPPAARVHTRMTPLTCSLWTLHCTFLGTSSICWHWSEVCFFFFFSFPLLLLLLTHWIRSKNSEVSFLKCGMKVVED